MSLSDSVIQLIDAMDDFNAKLRIKLASKRATAAAAYNALKFQNKTLAEVYAELRAIFNPHTDINPGNPHNLTPALIGTMSRAEIDAAAESKLPKEANSIDFIGHPSIVGNPMASNLSLSSTAIQHVRLEKHPGDVLVANVLTSSSNNAERHVWTQIKSPAANSKSKLLPTAYAKAPNDTIPISFGDGYMVYQRAEVAGYIYRRTTDEGNTNSLQLYSGTNQITANMRNPKDDCVVYHIGNRMGQFSYLESNNSLNCYEQLFLIDPGTHQATGPTANEQSSTLVLQASAFNGAITDYVTWSGTVPVSSPINIGGRNFRRDIILDNRGNDSISFHVITRAWFYIGTYKRKLVQFVMKETYLRSRTGNMSFSKPYTSPKFAINYEVDMTADDMLYDDTGYGQLLNIPNVIGSRTAFYQGTQFIYGFNYPIDGSRASGGVFWKKDLVTGREYVTDMEFSKASNAMLTNGTYLGRTSLGWRTFFGKSLYGRAVVTKVGFSGASYSVTDPFKNLTGGIAPVSDLEVVNNYSTVFLTQPGQSFKIAGFSDLGADNTSFTAARWLYGAEGVTDEDGSVTEPGVPYTNTVKFPLALQQQLDTAVRAAISHVSGYDSLVMDIIIPPTPTLPAFVVAYAVFGDDSTALSSRILISAALLTFQPNVRTGTIASFSNLNLAKVIVGSVGEVSVNHDLGTMWTDNSLCAPFIVHKYSATEYVVKFDLLPVFANGIRNGKKTCRTLKQAYFFTVSGNATAPISGIATESLTYTEGGGYLNKAGCFAKLTATTFADRLADPAILGYSVYATATTAYTSSTTTKYLSGAAEFTPLFTSQGYMPFSLKGITGYVYISDNLGSQLIAHGSANSIYTRVFLTLDGSNLPLLAYSSRNDTVDNTVRTDKCVEILNSTASRTSYTTKYNYPRVGMNSYLISNTPEYRSIMTVPNANV